MTCADLAVMTCLAAAQQFKFKKSRQLFIRPRNEPLSVVAMCVCNPAD